MNGQWRGTARVAVIGCVIAALQSGCSSKFEGPYPCAPGYASCSSANACETNLESDGDNCGACGSACGLGAACAKSKCGAPAERFATLQVGTQVAIAINSTALFWSDQDGIVTLPLAGGTPTTVATNVFSCNGVPFAVDDEHVYYFSNGGGSGGPGVPVDNGGLTALSLATGTRTTLLANPASNKGGNGCGAIAVDANNVYVLASLQPGGGPTNFELIKVPLSGGAAVTLAMGQGNGKNSFVVAGDVVLIENQNNGPDQLLAVPTAGGQYKTIPINLNLYGFNAFTADTKNIFVLGSGCGCCSCGDQSNTNSDGPPMGGVGKLQLDGSHGTFLGGFTGQALGMAVDADNVYWSTDTALWKAPIAGGAAVPVAGGLSAGGAAQSCKSCGGQSANLSMPIALDAKSVYIVDPVAGAILKVAK